MARRSPRCSSTAAPRRPCRGHVERDERAARARARAAIPGDRVRRGALPDQVVEGARARASRTPRAAARPRRRGAERCSIGFSMGGAVSIGVAGHDAVARRARAVALDPGAPVARRAAREAARRPPGRAGPLPARDSRASARELARGFERARALGVEGTYELIPAACTAAPSAGPSGRLVRLPRWRAWVDAVGAELERFQASLGGLSRAGAARADASLGRLHVPGEAELLERPDRPPRDVELQPVEAVARRARERVVVVVPPSPIVSIATTQLFRLSSRERYERLPNMWQIEFTLNVACWYAKTRTRPPQTSASRPSAQLIPPTR